MTATLIDLAVRGYLKIELLQAKSWWRQANYRFTKLKDSSLELYEAGLLSALFDGGSDTSELKDFKNNVGKSKQMSKAIQSLRSEVGKDLKQKGYYTTSPTNYVWLFCLW